MCLGNNLRSWKKPAVVRPGLTKGQTRGLAKSPRGFARSPRDTSPAALIAARRAKRDEFADPDLFERNRDEEDIGIEPEDPAAKAALDDEELPLGEGPSLEAGDAESEDDY